MEHRHKEKYGASIHAPEGEIPADLNRCAEEVYPPKALAGRQCRRFRGYGPNKIYCSQHGREHEARAAQKELPL